MTGPHALIDDAIALGSVMLIGAMDTGKSTLGRALAAAALAAGRTVAYIDADIGNSTIGPPTCVGLRVLRRPEDLGTLDPADMLHFVGAISPDRHVLQQVIATARLAEEGRTQADLAIIDTTGTVSGVVGETLKYHKAELIRPDRVVALQRGSEIEAAAGMLRRFLSVDVVTVPADPDVRSLSPDERAAQRIDRFRLAFSGRLERWRVRPTVFAPTIPVGLDLDRLDGMLVGIQDSAGGCLGLGRLEHSDDVLRVVTNAGEGMHGLRLGSLRIDLDTFRCESVNLRQLMFGI